MEHLLKTTHGARTRMGCAKGHEGSQGGGSGGGEGCECVDATEQEVKRAVESALVSFEVRASE